MFHCSFLVGKDELPITEREEGPNHRRHGNTLVSRLSQLSTFQRINKSLQTTPKHFLCQHSYGCVHYVTKVGSFIEVKGQNWSRSLNCFASILFIFLVNCDAYQLSNFIYN